MKQATNDAPLVSIVMPAYRPDYLSDALNSVLQQTYRPLELVICDDSDDTEIRGIVETLKAQADFPIHYERNDTALGELRGTARAIKLASGAYIKFLHDDDRLHPDCVNDLVAAMEADSSLALATSRRRRIDASGAPLPDITATAFPFEQDVIIHGGDVVSFLAEHLINFIGEPSTALCRRSDILEFGDQLSTLNGKLIEWVGDLAMYTKLLQKGHLVMLARPLADYRVSDTQYSQTGRDAPAIAIANHLRFQTAIRDLGWYRALGTRVRIAPITRFKTRVFKPCDLLAAINRATGLGGIAITDWLANRQPLASEKALIDERLAAREGGPKIGVMLLDHNGNLDAVQATLASLEQRNLYRNIDVKVLSMAAEALAELAVPVIAVSNCARGLNQAIQGCLADWVLVAETGVEFTPGGLLTIALDLLDAPTECLAVFADEVTRSADGELGLLLRPDFNLDLFLSFPSSMTRHWIYRRALFNELGGFAEKHGQAFELELQLRLIESYGLACVGHVSEPLMLADQLEMVTREDERAVIEKHLRARGYIQPRVASRFDGRYEIDYGHSASPSVSILFVLDSQLARFQHSLQTVLEKTAYRPYEVMLLAQGAQDEATEAWLQGIEDLAGGRIRVLRFPPELAPAAMRNQAASQAVGEFLLWLSPAISVFECDWLQQLLNHALRPEVGAVGGKLLAADGTIAQAGLLLGHNGPVGKAFEGRGLGQAGYLSRLLVEQNYSAVSGACLMLRKQLFIDCGGFDEDPSLARWLDVDLCLRLQQAGLQNVWTPRVQLLLNEDPVAPANSEEEDALYARWLPVLARDRASNPNVALTAEQSFALDPLSLNWQPLQSWRPLPRILAHPSDLHGCGHYRVIQPFNALREAGLIEGTQSLGLFDLPTLERYSPDVLILQRQLGDDRLKHMGRMHMFSRAFKVYELDDYLPGVPMKSVHRKHFAPNDMSRYLRRGLSQVDRLVASTEPLAEALGHLSGDVRVVKNCLDPRWWRGLSSRRCRSEKPRVGWAGGSSHTGDLEMIADVVKDLAGEVDWVFFGMCPERLRPYVKEFHPGVPIGQYPATLAGMDLDLALAPVEQNLFNECKSNLRVLEYGICGFPVIASDVRCYQGELPVTRVKNRYKDWVDAVRMHLADIDATAKMGDALKEAVGRDYMLEGDNLSTWLKAWLPDAH